MNADKFGAEYASCRAADGGEAECSTAGTGQRFCVPYPARECSCAADDREELVDTIRILREALQEAWLAFDRLGALAPDDERLVVLRGNQFASAALRVRAAMLKTHRVTKALS